MSELLSFDRSLFTLINQIWTCGFFDIAAPIITDFSLWVPLLLPVYLYLLFGDSAKHRSLALLLLLGVGVSDTVSSRIVKKLTNRKRPCCEEPTARKLIGCKTSKSFPSSHAANTAMVAGIVLLENGFRPGLPLLMLSAVVAYTRVYTGVHYPLDAFGGMALGLMLSMATVFLSRKLASKKSLCNSSFPAPQNSGNHSVTANSRSPDMHDQL